MKRTIVCVLRTGGDFDVSWVRALTRGIREHLPSPEIICLSDQPLRILGVERLPLLHDWLGWWSKAEVFRLSFPFLYLDLDTLPVGDLREIASYGGPMAMLSDLYQESEIASGIMAVTPGSHTERIYEKTRRRMSDLLSNRRYRARSDYWYREVMKDPPPERLQKKFPGQIFSFKKHARKAIPEGARLICGHGSPRFSSSQAGWAHDLWQERAYP